ncbi:hypothetical protein, partial [Aeromonas caviae]|uniref:hypothetical protein n=1 Tax=Aeromonas caviae TaxID=648 RepID=UPI002B4A92C6
MMKVLAVMTYFQISLPTHNWDSAFFIHILAYCISSRRPCCTGLLSPKSFSGPGETPLDDSSKRLASCLL